MDFNTILDAAYAAAVVTIIRFLVGRDGVAFGWTVVKTVARWAVNK